MMQLVQGTASELAWRATGRRCIAWTNGSYRRRRELARCDACPSAPADRCNGSGGTSDSEPSPPLLRRKLPGRSIAPAAVNIACHAPLLPAACCLLAWHGANRWPASHVLPPRPLPAPASPDGTTTATTAPRNRTDGDVRPPLPPPLLESRMCSSRSRA